jgi:hypothetical protein
MLIQLLTRLDCPNQYGDFCGGDTPTWVSAICSCVPARFLLNQEFLDIVYFEKTCSGGKFSSSTDLNSLTFCTSIAGSLELSSFDGTSPDLFPLQWIKSIQGFVMNFSHLNSQGICTSTTTQYSQPLTICEDSLLRRDQRAPLPSTQSHTRLSFAVSLDIVFLTSENTNLLSLGPLIALSSVTPLSSRILVMNNSGLCFSFDPFWASVSTSFLEFGLSEVFFLTFEIACANYLFH